MYYYFIILLSTLLAAPLTKELHSVEMHRQTYENLTNAELAQIGLRHTMSKYMTMERVQELESTLFKRDLNTFKDKTKTSNASNVKSLVATREDPIQVTSFTELLRAVNTIITSRQQQNNTQSFTLELTSVDRSSTQTDAASPESDPIQVSTYPELIAGVKRIISTRQTQKQTSPFAINLVVIDVPNGNTPSPAQPSPQQTQSPSQPTGAAGNAPTGDASLASAPLNNLDNILFLAPATLGNSGRQYMLNLDTGSSDTWFRGPNCQSQDNSCSGDRVDPAEAGLQDAGATFTTVYGSGAVTGTISTGLVTVAGRSAEIPIGLSTNLRGFEEDGGDGLMGLAFNGISQISRAAGSSASFLDAIAPTNPNGGRNIVSFFLSNSARTQGLVTFGSMDPTRYTGEITFIPLNSRSFWQFDYQGSTFSVNGEQSDLAGSTPNAIADTGTTLWIMDTAVAASINQRIGATMNAGQTQAFPDCDAALQGPEITFNIQGRAYVIPASIYVIRNGPGCFSGFSGGAEEIGLSILGGTFLRAYYSVHDVDNGQIGFAKSVENMATAG